MRVGSVLAWQFYYMKVGHVIRLGAFNGMLAVDELVRVCANQDFDHKCVASTNQRGLSCVHPGGGGWILQE